MRPAIQAKTCRQSCDQKGTHAVLSALEQEPPNREAEGRTLDRFRERILMLIHGITASF